MSNRMIYKYPLGAMYSTIAMPKGAQVLTAQLQGDKLCLWALVDPEASQVEREVKLHGTGHTIVDAEQQEYVATVQSGQFVWHVFILRDVTP